jgi:hypothetical protein
MGKDPLRVGGVTLASRVQATLSRALAYALWAGIVLALTLGVANFAGSGPAPAGPAAGSAQAVPVPPPGGCAELVVAAWLAGDTRALAGVTGAPRSGPEDPGREAARTYTAAVTPAGSPDRWGYLVGAEVRVRDQAGTWQPAGAQFFTVTMVRTGSGCGGWSPATLPAQVPPPPLAGAAPDPYPVRLAASGTELTETLEAFFGAMLAGGGSLERYQAPGGTVTAIDPPPYRDVRLVELSTTTGAPLDRDGGIPPDGTSARLLATVSTGPDGLPLVYPVTAGVRGGRWEIVAIDPLVGTAPAGPVTPDPAAPDPTPPDLDTPSPDTPDPAPPAGTP